MKILKDNTLVVLDIETTGISPHNCEIIEIYMIKLRDNKKIDEYYSKFKPNGELPLFISKLTGIYEWHLKNSPEIKNEIEKINNFLKNSIIVGHNLNFDLSFLNMNLNKNKFVNLPNERLDTLKLSRAVLRGKIKNHKLQTLSNFYKTHNKNEHNAKADVLTTYEVLQNLLKEKSITNIDTVKNLNDFILGIDKNLKNKYNIKEIPSGPGIYLFLKDQKLQYIGKSKNLKNRISSHLSFSRSFKSNKIVNASNKLLIEKLDNELTALILEQRIINQHNPRFNRRGKFSQNIYWIKLKSNKTNLEISKIKNTPNTLFKIGPFLSYSKAKNFKFMLNELLNLINCKKNNSRKTKCDISILKDTPCACVESFDMNLYIQKLNIEIKLFFDEITKSITKLKEEVGIFSDNLEYEKAQILMNYQSLLNEYIYFQKLEQLINNKDSQIIEILNKFNINIENQEVKIKNKSLFDSKIKQNNEVTYYNELHLILRFIRNQKPNTMEI